MSVQATQKSSGVMSPQDYQNLIQQRRSDMLGNVAKGMTIAEKLPEATASARNTLEGVGEVGKKVKHAGQTLKGLDKFAKSLGSVG